MICDELISPRSIAVLGASDNLSKPGGKVLQNLIDHGFEGELFAVNPKKVVGEGFTHIDSYSSLPHVDLAIIAIPAVYVENAVADLLLKGTKAFILFSAGFSETGEEGRILELRLRDLINEAGATLIGPNCIGIIQKNYKGVFTSPVPEYHDLGCELISSSGATAVFILEAAEQCGLKFSNIYSIGNAIQTGVEEILEHMDKSYKKGHSPNIKLLYLEHISNPFKFIKHTTSLIKKGCHIAAIKAGHSEAGGRAASSHTGAITTSDDVIRALFDKCGIVYCSGREELISVAGIFQTKAMSGNRIAIITHAGGSAVMLTDTLNSGGVEVPYIGKEKAGNLLKELNPGSSVDNPIDFLATGNAVQLGKIIDFCEDFENIDAMVVVFGSPGLFNVREVYEVLLDRTNKCRKPIYAVLPSVVNAADEIRFYLDKGKINFPDEVVLGQGLVQVYRTPALDEQKTSLPEMDFASVRNIINASHSGFLPPSHCEELMDAVGIKIAKQRIVRTKSEIADALSDLQFPLVLKVDGPIHKTEVNGVRLNIGDETTALRVFDELMTIEGSKGVLFQEMILGEELYCGAIKKGQFGHLVLCGLGGIFLELIRDTSAALAPVSTDEARKMIRNLKGYPLIQGYRNRPPLNEEAFVEVICRVAAMVHLAPEIIELDLNPLIATTEGVYAVDVRIKIES